jgi:hypothetical protein
MDGIADFINILKDHWYKKSALIFITIIPLVILISICQFKFNTLDISQVTSIFLITLIMLVLWYISNRIPNFSKNKINLLFVIKTETQEQYDCINFKLIEKIEDKLNINFRIHLMNRHKANSYKYDNESLSLLIDSSNANMILFGKCYSGNIDSIENIVLEFKGAILHKPMPSEVSKLLSIEMQQLIRNEMYIPKSNDILNFKLYIDRIELVIKYLLGLSFYLSADFHSSKSFYEDIYNEVQLIKNNEPVINSIKTRIPHRLYEVHEVLATVATINFRITKDEKYLDEMKTSLDLMNKYNPNSYVYFLKLSIYYFLNGRQINNVKKTLNKCKNNKDISWRYSVAFIDVYNGKLEEAYKKYKNLFNKEYHHELLFDIEDFIVNVIEMEPNKYEMYFALALINYYYKGDNNLAYKYFKTFIDNAQINNQYINVVNISLSYIAQVRDNSDPSRNAPEAAITSE